MCRAGTNGAEMINPLRAYLSLHDMSATEFAKKVGVHPSFLSRLMAGKREADAGILARVKETTGGRVTPDRWVRWWSSVQPKEPA